MAQSPRSAVGGEAGLWAGGEFSWFHSDYHCQTATGVSCKNSLEGITPLVDLNFRQKWGAEGEARWLHWGGTGGMKESNYLIGPRYRFFRYDGIGIWGKVLLGGGWITTPNYPQAGSLQGSYFAYAPGATVDYPVTPRLLVRVDYEYQFWPSFAGPPTGTAVHNNGLNPNGISFGAEYRFLGH